MLIDVHTHIGSVDGQTHNAEVLRQYVTTCRVDVALLTVSDRAAGDETLDETEANAMCLKLCQENPRFAPVYWVRPGRFDSSPHAFAGAMTREPFVAALFCPALHGYELDDEDRLTPYMTALSRVERPAIIALDGRGKTHAGHLHAFARKWSKVPLVLYSALAQAGLSSLLDTIRNAQRRGDDHVYVDTAHADIDDVVAAVEAIGAQRVLFGSDACHHGDAHLSHVQKQLKKLRERLARDTFDLVTAGNARRVFGVEPRHLPV